MPVLVLAMVFLVVLLPLVQTGKLIAFLCSAISDGNFLLGAVHRVSHDVRSSAEEEHQHH